MACTCISTLPISHLIPACQEALKPQGRSTCNPSSSLTCACPTISTRLLTQLPPPPAMHKPLTQPSRVCQRNLDQKLPNTPLKHNQKLRPRVQGLEVSFCAKSNQGKPAKLLEWTVESSDRDFECKTTRAANKVWNLTMAESRQVTTMGGSPSGQDTFSSMLLITWPPTTVSTRSSSRNTPSSLLSRNVSVSSASSPVSAMATAAKKVLVPIANGTEPLEAVITIDVLRRAGAEVTVASVEKELGVDACHGIKIIADALISNCSDNVFDLISLPGGMPGATRLRDCEALKSMVKKQAEQGKLHAALCAAPAVAFASWGLLQGKKATCYPSFMDQLSSATAVESRVQLDGTVVTSRGPGTAMEYSVALVEQLLGKEKADEISGPLLMRPKHGEEYVVKEFNPMKWTFNGDCPQILVPIASGSEEMEAVIIIDVLRRAKAKVVVASLDDKLAIVASRNVKLAADMLLDDAANLTYDLIVLPGGIGGAKAFAASEKLISMMKKQSESNMPYGAICASPALALEPHGLLKGKKATAFPALCDKLSDHSEADNRVVVDGNLITSRGPGTTMEFALAIIEKFYGREKAIELAKVMLFVQQ